LIADSWIIYPQQLQHIKTVGITSAGKISPLSFIVGMAAIPSGSQLFVPQTGHCGLKFISPNRCVTIFSCFGVSGTGANHLDFFPALAFGDSATGFASGFSTAGFPPAPPATAVRT
jgi:hypothetical protein